LTPRQDGGRTIGRWLGPSSVCGRTNARTTMASSDENYNQEYSRLRRLKSGFDVRKISVSLRGNPRHSHSSKTSRAGESRAKVVALGRRARSRISGRWTGKKRCADDDIIRGRGDTLARHASFRSHIRSGKRCCRTGAARSRSDCVSR
jgi:hypothetical protein